MNTHWKNFLFTGLFMLLAVVLAGCSTLGQQAPAASDPTPVLDVPIVTQGGDVVVEGSVVPRDFVRYYTRTGGLVSEVLVKEGDIVVQDQVIARMDGSDQAQAALTSAELERVNAQEALDELNDNAAMMSAQAQETLAKANAALIEAQQQLDDYDSPQYDTDLDTAITNVNNAKDDLDDAQDDWDKNKDLDVDNATRKTSETNLDTAQKKYDDAVRERDRLENELETYQAAVVSAQAAVDVAQRDVDARANNAPDPDDIARAQARLTSAEAQVKAAQANLDDLEMKAPFAGTVAELDVVPGEVMMPNSQVAVIADLSELFIETTDLTEMDVVSIEAGQPAVITPDALPELELDGIVELIDQISGKKGGDVTYTVRLKMNETDSRLRWGMTTEVRFEGN